jgi:hypothetical protein
MGFSSRSRVERNYKQRMITMKHNGTYIPNGGWGSKMHASAHTSAYLSTPVSLRFYFLHLRSFFLSKEA